MLATLLIPLALISPVWAELAVANVRAAQRAGTNLVDIDYDVTGTTSRLRITLEVSADNGATYAISASSLSGAAGYNVTPGTNLRMTWDAGSDWSGHLSSTMRYRVVANDNPPPPGFELIPAGEFLMGDQSNPPVGNPNEYPVHAVYVSAFFMGKCEVSAGEWAAVRTWGRNNGYSDISVGVGKSDYPVIMIDWYDMAKWCNARSEMEGLTPCYTVAGAIYRTGEADPDCNWSANGYRLPSEAEWEKAARGGVTGKNFPWGGDTITHSQANYFSASTYSYDVSPTRGYHPAFDVGTGYNTSPVGIFAPNGYGLYDVAGNLHEACWDWYGPYSAGMQTDPHGPASGSTRVAHGASWMGGAIYARCSYRSDGAPTWKYTNYGFILFRFQKCRK